MRRIVVVGASLAGLRAAETLREEGFAGSLMVIGAEDRPPYSRPPLSKQILTGKQSFDQIVLPNGNALEVQWRLGKRAVGLDVGASRLDLHDGSTLDFDGLLIATGVIAREPLVAGWGLAGTHLLRTLDDAMALRADMVAGKRLVIAGAGFIGCEVAASARELGMDVTIIDPAPAPMVRVLTPEISSVFVDIHREHGVDFRFGCSVAAINGTTQVRSVLLDDGSHLTADVVVFGVGSIPATAWLQQSSLVLQNGIVCDEYSLAEGGGGRIAAAGDVASWRNISYGGSMMRVEHWSNAVDQAANASRNLLHGPTVPYTPVISLWSDQYGYKLQALGTPALGGRIEIAHGSLAARRFIAECWSGDRLQGVVALNMPARIAGYRRRLEGEIATFASDYEQRRAIAF